MIKRLTATFIAFSILFSFCIKANAVGFSLSAKSAILINVARGPVVNEDDLVKALEDGEIAAAGLDVLSLEPMTKDNPLLRIQDSKKLFVTPHMAWAPTESRQRILDCTVSSIRAFLEGEPINTVN